MKINTSKAFMIDKINKSLRGQSLKENSHLMIITLNLMKVLMTLFRCSH